ncbi:MAG: peptidoglycan-binding domain-containing protein [Bacteroidota bacterium]
MSEEHPNVTVAKFNFKQAIVVALITGITTIGGTFLTLKSSRPSKNSKPQESQAVAGSTNSCDQEVNKLKAQLNNSTITFSSLADISEKHFSSNSSQQEVKKAIRELVNNANQYEDDSRHFMHKLFRLKKLMLENGGNVNVRINYANKEACILIQDLLKGIEYYKGSIDGNVESTREAVERFQKNLNRYTEGYFPENNIGIVGRKTFNAILEHYERS